MIRYTVVWHRHAEAKLAELWVDSFALPLIQNAADTIENLLKYDAESVGSEIGTRSTLLAYLPAYDPVYGV